MRCTAKGRLLLALAVAMGLASLPLRSVAPALGALLLLGLVGAARRSVAEVRAELTLDAPRRTPAGKPFLAVARAQLRPALVARLALDTPLGAELLALDAERGLGTARWEAALRARAPGTVALRGARLEVADPLGLWARELDLPGQREVHVLPEGSLAAAGAKLGHVDRPARGRRAFDETPEVEKLRWYEPGDRLRDIDWAHSSKLQRLLTRERVREAPRPVVLLVDATRAMRWHRGQAMLGTSARAAMTLAGAARAGGVPLGIVAYSERGVLRMVRAARSRDAVERAARALAELPEGVAVDDVPPLGGGEQDLTGAERRFLGALAPFVQGPLPGASPLEAALAAVGSASGQPSIVVLLTSVDLAPRAAVVAARRLLRRGHLVAVVSPTLPSHLASEAMEERAAWGAWCRANRALAAQQLARLGVPLATMARGEELEGAREVVAWAS